MGIYYTLSVESVYVSLDGCFWTVRHCTLEPRISGPGCRHLLDKIMAARTTRHASRNSHIPRRKRPGEWDVRYMRWSPTQNRTTASKSSNCKGTSRNITRGRQWREKSPVQRTVKSGTDTISNRKTAVAVIFPKSSKICLSDEASMF